MRVSRLVVSMFSVGVMVLGAGVVSSQDYPNKPIRLVTSDIGGSPDFVSRLIAQGISGSLGQRLIVDNRGLYISPETVAKALPDGYTLLVAANAFWLGPLLAKRPYDPVRDFLPVALTNSAPNVLVVHPSLPVNSVKELIALAKARSGELNYASAVTGSSSHLAGELFKAMAGVNIARVPYRGNGPAVIGLIGGEAQLMFPTSGAAAPHIKSGKLRAMAVASAQPSALYPGLPTVAASGLPGYEAASMTGIFAPAKTPTTIINRLNGDIVRFLAQADVKEKLFNAGLEAVGSSPEQLGATMKSEMVRMGKVIKDAGIKDE